ncbi:MAG TPA: OsmC family protein [Acidimicrobiia bacterium]
MEEPHFYRVDVKSEGLKTGFLDSPDIPALDVASPPQFGGPAGVWSPEHLFVASVASCLMTTFRAIADRSGLEVLEYSDSASGMLVRGDDRLYKITDVTLRPRVVVADPAKVDRVLRLIDKAEQVCLISRSIAATVHVEPSVIVASPAQV